MGLTNFGIICGDKNASLIGVCPPNFLNKISIILRFHEHAARNYRQSDIKKLGG